MPRRLIVLVELVTTTTGVTPVRVPHSRCYAGRTGNQDKNALEDRWNPREAPWNGEFLRPVLLGESIVTVPRLDRPLQGVSFRGIQMK